MNSKLPDPDLNTFVSGPMFSKAKVLALLESNASGLELPPDADVDDWNQAVMVVWVLARKHDNTIPSHWLDAMRSALTVKDEK